ncbi:MAG: alternative ribosome rescue aminoacyl-tRNA hydrolase ArfB [Pseudomonadales bacterium]
MNEIEIPPDAVQLSFVRSSGPGGQHVNKVATAVQLRVNLAKTRIPLATRKRLVRLAGQRINSRGELMIHADRFRSQARNREDAFDRLEALLTKARQVPKRRIPTKVSARRKQQRSETKKRQGSKKKLRGKPGSND